MSLWNRLFGRKPVDPPTPPINDDWAVGDIAECVVQSVWFSMHTMEPLPGGGPKQGERFRVVGVQCSFAEMLSRKIWFLQFATTGCMIFQADAFRKVRPVHDEATAEDKAFLKSLLRTKAPQKEDA